MEDKSFGPVKNFRVLRVSKRAAAIITICQMPFFFMALFLFNQEAVTKIEKSFFLDLYFYFLLCFCFCLSLTWSLMNVITTYVIIAITNNGAKEPTEPHEKYIS